MAITAGTSPLDADLYQVLGVAPHASAEEIDLAFSRARERFEQISEAYRIVSHSKARCVYDSWGWKEDEANRSRFAGWPPEAPLEPSDLRHLWAAPKLAEWLRSLGNDVLGAYGERLAPHFQTPEQLLEVYVEDGAFVPEAFCGDFGVENEEHRFLFAAWFADALATRTPAGLVANMCDGSATSGDVEEGPPASRDSDAPLCGGAPPAAKPRARQGATPLTAAAGA